MWAQNNPEGLKEKIRKQKNSANAEQLRSLQATLTAAEKRLTQGYDSRSVLKCD